MIDKRNGLEQWKKPAQLQVRVDGVDDGLFNLSHVQPSAWARVETIKAIHARGGKG
jgi:hypothetical protein